jgi:hypothetical protein
LLPKSVRGELVIRRTCRKKIHDRIMAVSGMDYIALADYGALNAVSGLVPLIYLCCQIRTQTVLYHLHSGI